MTNCSLSRRPFVIYVLSQTANSAETLTSMAKDYVEKSLPKILLPQIIDRVYRLSQEESARLRESVPYVKVYRYNPKHLYAKLNVYRDNGQI